MQNNVWPDEFISVLFEMEFVVTQQRVSIYEDVRTRAQVFLESRQ